jgi:L-lysine exporter family protein LysE/ArgO
MGLGALLPAFLTGLAFGAVSLMSIGPNNVLLLREGLSGSRPGLVAGVMWLSYACLLGTAIFAGDRVSPLVDGVAPLLGWGGAMVLATMGVVTLRSSTSPTMYLSNKTGARETMFSAAQRVVRVVWLNPLTYLELLAVPAALALPIDGLAQRSALFAGLLLVFALNCFGFSFGATMLSPIVSRPGYLRLFDRASGAILIGLAIVVAAHAAQPRPIQAVKLHMALD